MLEMLSRMADDRLWIYTGIAGSIFGALFLAYMKDTKLGLWAYAKWDWLLDSIRDRFGWTWLDQPEDAWKTVHPKIAKKLEQLEARVQQLENSQEK